MSDFSWFCQIFWEVSDFLKNQAVEEALYPRGIEIYEKVRKCDSLTHRIENQSRRVVFRWFWQDFRKKSDIPAKI